MDENNKISITVCGDGGAGTCRLPEKEALHAPLNWEESYADGRNAQVKVPSR
jgi:hypothetical protein